MTKRRFLNIGGGTRAIHVPACFDNWEHVLLDIKQMGGFEPPDLLIDARTLADNPTLAGSFDAAYCSHNLEHYYRMDLGVVLAGIRAVIKPDGFAFIRVPDVVAAVEDMVKRGLNFHDTPFPEHKTLHSVQYHDIIYGRDLGKKLSPEQHHRQAFTIDSLCTSLNFSGFNHFYSSKREEGLEIIVIAFINPPIEEYKYMFSLDVDA